MADPRRPLPAATAPDPATRPGAREVGGGSLLREVAARSAHAGPGAPAGALATAAADLLVGQCTDEVHPALAGRVRVRWADPRQGQREAWLGGLRGIVVRQGDRVLLQQPAGWPEPLILGVVDGLRPRQRQHRPGPTVCLRSDEALEVRAADGAALLKIHRTEAGPVVRLLDPCVRLDLDGELEVKAAAIRLQATRGSVSVQASEDVDIQGEVVHLN